MEVAAAVFNVYGIFASVEVESVAASATGAPYFGVASDPNATASGVLAVPVTKISPVKHVAVDPVMAAASNYIRRSWPGRVNAGAARKSRCTHACRDRT